MPAVFEEKLEDSFGCRRENAPLRTNQAGFDVRPFERPRHHLQAARLLVARKQPARTEDEGVAALAELDQHLVVVADERRHERVPHAAKAHLRSLRSLRSPPLESRGCRRARELEGAERNIVWKEIVAQDPGFAEYEERRRGIREIPVVVFEPRDAEDAFPREDVHVMYGMGCSYFTGKLEAYFHTKGLPFRSVELDGKQFRECSRRTGVAQLPCIETPDGEWLTDTTAIMEHFEAEDVGPAVRPEGEAAAFCSLLFEDLFDEWYWRPALYYRWAFDEDARLMSNQIARTLVRDKPWPLFLRRLLVLRRQRIVYMKKDGVTKQTAPALEMLYMDSLRALEAIFAKRPFLFGDRPCEADFGLFGPFFRHFFCDPTPGALMRKHAPHLTHWVTRLWKTRPSDLAETETISGVPRDLGFFFETCARDYLPYLEANASAVADGRANVRYVSGGANWEIPSAPYRAECFNELKRRFAALSPEANRDVRDVLPQAGVDLLEQPMTRVEREAGLLGRLGRRAGRFD